LKKGKLEVSDDEFAKTAEMIKSEIMKVKM
jgi:hypothetical protein